jgi:hypothetical protein
MQEMFIKNSINLYILQAFLIGTKTHATVPLRRFIPLGGGRGWEGKRVEA